MTNYYYLKSKKKISKKSILRATALGMFLCGIFVLLYVFLPFLNWHVYFAPAFASQSLDYPIPKKLLVSTSNKPLDEKFLNAKNWFPTFVPSGTIPKLSSYNISIPKLFINNAMVSTVDYDLSKHLVQYQGTVLPSENGNTVIFGHSTLPQLFNPKDYTTIFANAYTLKSGDTITIHINSITYTYTIYNTIVVDPTETSIFNQDYSYSHLTLVTCTPPGTIWKRLIIKAKIQSL